MSVFFMEAWIPRPCQTLLNLNNNLMNRNVPKMEHEILENNLIIYELQLHTKGHGFI